MRRLVICLMLLAPSAQAQTANADIDAIRRSLGDALSFATFGGISGLSADAEVTKEGDGYRIHMPLTGLIAPSDPAVTALAHPTGDGAWDVQSLTLPPTATINPSGPAAGKVTYTIGRQDISAHIVPDLKQQTTYVAKLDDIRIDSRTGKQAARQTIAHYGIKGTMSAGGDGRLAFTSTGEASNWTVLAKPENGHDVALHTRRIAMDVAVQGLDKAKGERLRSSLQRLLADLPKPGQALGPSTLAVRENLKAVLNDVTGLLTRFEANETLEGVTFTGDNKRGGAGTVIIGMHGDTAHQSLDAGIDLAVNGVTVPAETAGPYAAYVPKHISLRNRIRGLPSDQVVSLLRSALAENPDPMALEAAAIRILSTPGASVSIDPFSFDSGPLALTGTAHLVPSGSGGFAGRIHIIASGVDALIAQAQGDPGFARIMPILYLAKGMAKSNGTTLVWDIDLDRQGIRINGTRFGHPPHRR